MTLALQEEEGILNFKESGFPNVLLIDLSMDPFKAVELIKNIPTTVISKVVPIEKVVRTREDSILEQTLFLADEKVSASNSFKVICDLRGRKYIHSEEDLKEKVSIELFDKLNLKPAQSNPQWIVQLEMVGENTGISVVPPGTILKKI